MILVGAGMLYISPAKFLQSEAAEQPGAIAAEQGRAEAYVCQRILDSLGRETRDLYPGVTYTNEVRMNIPMRLVSGRGVNGVRFVMRASPNVHVKQRIQEQPLYGARDLLSGGRALTNRVVFGETSVRARTPERAGVLEGTYVLARYPFTSGSPQTYAITDFMLEGVKIWNVNGEHVVWKARDLKTVSVNPAYKEPVVITEHVPGNDADYSLNSGVEFYFSIRNQRVDLDRSSDLENWRVMYSNSQTCPSFTLQIPEVRREASEYFRVRRAGAP